MSADLKDDIMSSAGFSSKLSWFVVILLCLILVSVFYWPLLVGCVPHNSDTTGHFVPVLSVHGGASVWNPYYMGGFPMYAEPQFQTSYPFRQLLRFLPPVKGVAFYLLGHIFVSALGMVVLLRLLGLGLSSALFGALVFSCGPFMYARLLNPSILFSQSWFPWVMAGMVAFAKTRGLKRAVVASLPISFVALLGYPHSIFYTFLVSALFALAALNKIPREERRPFFLCLVVAAFLAIGLSAIQILPAFNLLPDTIRAGISPDEVLQDSIKPLEIFFILFGSKQPSVRGDAAVYVGISALLVICLAVLTSGKDFLRRTFLWSFLLALSVGLALGKYLLVYRLFLLLPVLKWLAGPIRALCVFHLASSVLAGIALDSFLQNTHQVRKARVILTLTACVVLPIAVRQFLAFHPRSGISISLPQTSQEFLPVFLAMMGVGVVLLFMARRISRRIFLFGLFALFSMEMLRYHGSQQMPFLESEDFGESPAVKYVQEHSRDSDRTIGYHPTRLYTQDVNDRLVIRSLSPNLSSLYHIRDINGFDPFLPVNLTNLVDSTVGRRPDFEKQRVLILDRAIHPILDYLGIRFVIGNPYEIRIPGGIFATRREEAPHQAMVPDTEGRSIRGVGLVSFLDAPEDFPAGQVVASLLGLKNGRVVATRPVISGAHTASWLQAEDSEAPHPLAVETWQGQGPSGWASLGAYYSQVTWEPPMQLDEIQIIGETDAPFVVNALSVLMEEDGLFRRVMDDPVLPLYERAEDLPTAWLVSDAGVVDGTPTPDFWKTRNSWKTAVYIEGPSSKGAVAEPGSGKVTASEISALRWVYEVDADAPCILVTNQIYHQGWKALIDGDSTPTLCCNLLFRGVRIPKGKHEVIFTFLPNDLLLGAGITSFCLLMVGVLLIRNRPRSRRRAGDAPNLEGIG